MVITLLYRLAEWHALAKLRMHTENTLECLETSTNSIGRELRKFRDTTMKSFKCQELPKETATRLRRRERARANKAHTNTETPANPGTQVNTETPTNPGAQSDPEAPVNLGTNANQGRHIDDTQKDPTPAPKPKILNLFTYKFHALGDYVRTIRLFGTTDSYSTQIVSFHPIHHSSVLSNKTGRIVTSPREKILCQNQ